MPTAEKTKKGPRAWEATRSWEPRSREAAEAAAEAAAKRNDQKLGHKSSKEDAGSKARTICKALAARSREAHQQEIKRWATEATTESQQQKKTQTAKPENITAQPQQERNQKTNRSKNKRTEQEQKQKSQTRVTPGKHQKHEAKQKPCGMGAWCVTFASFRVKRRRVLCGVPF